MTAYEFTCLKGDNKKILASSASNSRKPSIWKNRKSERGSRSCDGSTIECAYTGRGNDSSDPGHRLEEVRHHLFATISCRRNWSRDHRGTIIGSAPFSAVLSDLTIASETATRLSSLARIPLGAPFRSSLNGDNFPKIPLLQTGRNVS